MNSRLFCFCSNLRTKERVEPNDGLENSELLLQENIAIK